MQVEQVIEMLQHVNKEWLIQQLSKPEYKGKRVILSGDDLCGDETDAELENTMSIRELIFD